MKLVEGPRGFELMHETCRDHPALLASQNSFVVLSYDQQQLYFTKNISCPRLFFLTSLTWVKDFNCCCPQAWIL